MFSITLRRSAAALGVVAVLLAAAGPASAATAGPSHPKADGFSLILDGFDCGVVSPATEELSGNYNFLLEAAGRAR